MSDESEKGFRVQDRRRFDAEGNLKPPEEIQTDIDPDPRARASGTPPPSAATASAGRAPTSGPTEAHGAEAHEGAPEHAPAEEPDVDAPGTVGFSELVLSVATNALAFLGRDEAGPEGTVSASKINLNLAAQNIDILAMLETKTRGNLTRAEAELLSSVLYDLRTLYIETAKVVQAR